MRLKFKVALTLIISSIKPSIGDEAFQYFPNPDLNYWTNETSFNVKVLPSRNLKRSKSPEPFQWNKYLDPKNDDFFREGEYTPPAPFMEIARNPSDENIANWFHYLELKNDITHRLQKRLEAYSSKKTRLTQDNETPSSAPVPPPQLILSEHAKRFRVRLYFDSNCPHCQHMMESLSELAKLGFWIELKQIDSNVSIRKQIPFLVTSSTSEELRQYDIQSVPLLLIGDLKRGTFFKLQGYQSSHTILQAIEKESIESQNQSHAQSKARFKTQSKTEPKGG